MALQNFIDYVGPAISAAWLNAVDRLKTTIFNDATTKAGARTALTSDAPLEVVNGGTGVRTIEDLADSLDPYITGGGGTGTAIPIDATYVNSFYPEGVEPWVDVATGASHPLSNFFADLAAAQAVYPHATALTDEIDWCAWQAASNHILSTAPDYGNGNYNWSTGHIKADGRYVVNKPIMLHHEYIIIEGKVCGARIPRGGNTSLTYNGPDGTDTAKIAILDFYPRDEVDDPPPGVLHTFSGGTFKCTNICFAGKGTATPLTAPSTTGYIWGIRLRNGSFCEIWNCAFGGGLLDAIVACSQLFLKIHDNFFYTVNRDCISILGFKNDFSTTVWIDDNEFGSFGRYAILQNYNGAIEPFPSVRRNSVEGGSSSSYYYNHPEHFVMGLCSAFCQIGGTYAYYCENRFEAMTTQIPQLWADMFFISVSYAEIYNNRMGGQAFSTYRDDPNRVTADYTTFVNTYNYVDINDTRNFHAPTSTDFKGASSCGNLSMTLFTGLTIDIEGVGLSNGSQNKLENGTWFPVVLPVDTSGAYYRVKVPGVAIPTLRLANVRADCTKVFVNGWSSFGPVKAHALALGVGSGTYETTTEHGYGTWASGTAYIAEYRPYIYAQFGKKYVQPLTYNGYVYECVVSGTSDVSEPAWPTTLGNTVTDGTVTWRCMSKLALNSGTAAVEYMQSFERRCIGDQPPTATEGAFARGDLMRNRIPNDANPHEWVCTAAGIPGTWRPIYSLGAFAGIYVSGGSTAQTIATATTAKLTCFTTGGLAVNCTQDAANDKITVTRAGKYRVTWDISFSCSVASVVWTFNIYNDGTVAANTGAVVKAGSTPGDVSAVAGVGFIQVAANKDIDLRAAHGDGGSVDITPKNANITLEWVGE